MRSKRTIWFVRHGERIDNLNADWKRTAKKWDDPWLSLRGQEQACDVGRRLANETIDIILTSPFTRCLQTTKGILSQFNRTLPLVVIEPGFGESLNACMRPPGRPSLEEIKEFLKFDETYIPVFDTLDEEPDLDSGCFERVGKTLSAVMKKFPTQNILIVSHGSPIASCYLELFKSWRYVGQCTIGKIIQDRGEMKLEFWGSKDHLQNKENLREEQSPGKISKDIPLYTMR